MKNEKNIENKITDEELNAVNGGYLYFNDNFEWEVIDKDGYTVKRGMWHKEQAEEAAREYGLSTRVITYNQLRDIREYHGWHEN
jgi:hypothetical protein